MENKCQSGPIWWLIDVKLDNAMHGGGFLCFSILPQTWISWSNCVDLFNMFINVKMIIVVRSGKNFYLLPNNYLKWKVANADDNIEWTLFFNTSYNRNADTIQQNVYMILYLWSTYYTIAFPVNIVNEQKRFQDVNEVNFFFILRRTWNWNKLEVEQFKGRSNILWAVRSASSLELFLCRF